ncbi:MAG: sigma-70 family RNA polymerase sigma factor [Chloroflexota bacterium]
MQSEESLVAQAKRGDEAAFSGLYEANFDKIYRYIALKIGDKIEAEDLTQQVFLNALKSISSFKWQGAPFSAWLFRIAHNQVVDYLRKRSRSPTVPLDERTPEVGSGDPQALTEISFSMEQVNLATKKLTRLQSEVISLRFAGGLSTAEVARILGKREGAIKALQHSAVIALRKALGVDLDEKR